MLDFDLAEFYDTETKRLKEAVRRNIDQFPTDFMFELTREEYNSLRSQTAWPTHPRSLPKTSPSLLRREACGNVVGAGLS
jgi:ORF6N domain